MPQNNITMASVDIGREKDSMPCYMIYAGEGMDGRDVYRRADRTAGDIKRQHEAGLAAWRTRQAETGAKTAELQDMGLAL